MALIGVGREIFVCDFSWCERWFSLWSYHFFPVAGNLEKEWSNWDCGLWRTRILNGPSKLQRVSC